MNMLQIAAQSIFVLMVSSFPKSIVLLVMGLLQQTIGDIVRSTGEHSSKIQDDAIARVDPAKHLHG